MPGPDQSRPTVVFDPAVLVEAMAGQLAKLSFSSLRSSAWAGFLASDSAILMGLEKFDVASSHQTRSYIEDMAGKKEFTINNFTFGQKTRDFRLSVVESFLGQMRQVEVSTRQDLTIPGFPFGQHLIDLAQTSGACLLVTRCPGLIRDRGWPDAVLKDCAAVRPSEFLRNTRKGFSPRQIFAHLCYLRENPQWWGVNDRHAEKAPALYPPRAMGPAR